MITENKNGSADAPIKILFLIDELNTGGTEKQLVWLAENLPRDRFCPVIGVLRKTPWQKNLDIETPLVNFRWSGLAVIKNFQLASRIRQYLNREKFDILQTQFVESEIYGTIAAKLCRQRPLIISTRRNLYHWTADDPWRFRLVRLLARWMVDRIIANSFAVQKKCCSVEGVNADKIVVLPNAVDTDRFKPADTGWAKKRLGFDPNRPVIGVVGNWRPVKGTSYFLRAASTIQARIPGAQFVLAGQGPQKKELVDLAQHLGVYSCCRFIEGHPDIPSLVAAFDVAVQPSLSESFSNVLLEYMAAGKSIVATRVGEAPLMLDHGQNGVLVEPEDEKAVAEAVLHLLENKETAAEMGRRAARSASSKWAAGTIMKQYIKFYIETAGR